MIEQLRHVIKTREGQISKLESKLVRALNTHRDWESAQTISIRIAKLKEGNTADKSRLNDLEAIEQRRREQIDSYARLQQRAV